MHTCVHRCIKIYQINRRLRCGIFPSWLISFGIFQKKKYICIYIQCEKIYPMRILTCMNLGILCIYIKWSVLIGMVFFFGALSVFHMYIYMCMYTCVYTCVYIYIFMYIHICTCVYIYIICIYIYTYTTVIIVVVFCLGGFMSLSSSICIYMYVHVCVYMHI